MRGRVQAGPGGGGGAPAHGHWPHRKGTRARHPSGPGPPLCLSRPCARSRPTDLLSGAVTGRGRKVQTERSTGPSCAPGTAPQGEPTGHRGAPGPLPPCAAVPAPQFSHPASGATVPAGCREASAHVCEPLPVAPACSGPQGLRPLCVPSSDPHPGPGLQMQGAWGSRHSSSGVPLPALTGGGTGAQLREAASGRGEGQGSLEGEDLPGGRKGPSPGGALPRGIPRPGRRGVNWVPLSLLLTLEHDQQSGFPAPLLPQGQALSCHLACPQSLRGNADKAGAGAQRERVNSALETTPRSARKPRNPLSTTGKPRSVSTCQ